MKMKMSRFRLEDYKGKFVMHVKTEEEYDTFSKFLYENGKTWCSGYGYLVRNHWEVNKSETCFDFNNGAYSYVDWLKDLDYTILEFSDFDWNACEFTKGQDVEC